MVVGPPRIKFFKLLLLQSVCYRETQPLLNRHFVSRVMIFHGRRYYYGAKLFKLSLFGFVTG